MGSQTLYKKNCGNILKTAICSEFKTVFFKSATPWSHFQNYPLWPHWCIFLYLLLHNCFASQLCFFSKRDTMWLYCFDYNIFAWSVSKSPEGSCVLFQCYVNVAWVKGENGRFYGERVYRENKSWIKLIFLREMKWLQIKYRFFKNRRSWTFIAHSNLLRYPWKYF